MSYNATGNNCKQDSASAIELIECLIIGNLPQCIYIILTFISVIAKEKVSKAEKIPNKISASHLNLAALSEENGFNPLIIAWIQITYFEMFWYQLFVFNASAIIQYLHIFKKFKEYIILMQYEPEENNI